MHVVGPSRESSIPPTLWPHRRDPPFPPAAVRFIMAGLFTGRRTQLARQRAIRAMPKMKTHKGTKKRFRLTATGKVKHRSAGTSHLAAHEPKTQAEQARHDHGGQGRSREDPHRPRQAQLLNKDQRNGQENASRGREGPGFRLDRRLFFDENHEGCGPQSGQEPPVQKGEGICGRTPPAAADRQGKPRSRRRLRLSRPPQPQARFPPACGSSASTPPSAHTACAIANLSPGWCKANIELDRKMLAEMAIADPTGIRDGRRSGKGRPSRNRRKKKDHGARRVPFTSWSLCRISGGTGRSGPRCGGRLRRCRRCRCAGGRADRVPGAKSGRLKAVQKGLGSVDKADKPAAGKRFNEVKQSIEAAYETATARWPTAPAGGQRPRQFDPTVPGIRPAWAACIQSRRRSKS